MESKIQPEHEPVVQTGKDPSVLPSPAVTLETAGEMGSVDLEKGIKRYTRRPSKSPKRHQKHRHTVLVPNTTGRYVFLGIFIFLLLSIILGFVGISPVISSCWAGLISLICLIVGMAYISGVGTTPSLFRHQRINFGMLCGISVLCMVFEGISCTGEGAPALFHVANIMGALILLASGVILLLPDEIPITTNLHPFIHQTKLKTRSGSNSPTANSVASVNKQKKVLSKTMTLYEDWPDPIPFPAKAIYTFNTTSPSELPFKKGDPLIVVDCRGNWWQAKHSETGRTGFIPSNFVQVIPKAKIFKRYLASSEDEVSVQEGQVVELMEHHEFASLIRTVEGSIGSVPTSCLEPIPDTALEKQKI